MFGALSADNADMFEWKDDYSVGNGSIDGQHQKLFAIGGELYDAMSAGQGRASMGRILDRLVHYTAVHFAHEERLMEEYGYPGLSRHKAEHEALTKQVLAFQAELQSGRASMTVQVLQFLKNWLERHIKVSDRAFAPCLKEKVVN